MKKMLAIVLMISVLTIASSALVSAQDGNVMMGGYLLLRLRCPAGGLSAPQRVEAVQRRVDALLSLGQATAPPTSVAMVGNSAALYAGNQLIVTVDPCDARANGTTPEALARVWGERFRTIYPAASPVKPGVGPPAR